MSIDSEIEKKAEELFYLLQKKAIYGLNSLNIGDVVYNHDLYKRTVISKPGRLNFIEYPSVFITVEVEYNVGNKKTEYFSLCDKNVVNGGYNLHRLFRDKADASLYAELLNIFFYKLTPTKVELISNEEIEKLPFLN